MPRTVAHVASLARRMDVKLLLPEGLNTGWVASTKFAWLGSHVARLPDMRQPKMCESIAYFPPELVAI